MWDIIQEIRRRGTMTGEDILQYSRTILGRNERSAGACIARALQYGHIRIVGTTMVKNRKYNIYA